MIRIKSDRIITGDSEISGYVYIDGSVIAEVSDRDLPVESEYDATGLTVSAGFIDIHTHGGGGHPFEGEVDDVVKGCNFHLGHGTTSICPTVSAAPLCDMRRSVENISLAMSSGEVVGTIIGAHLEGPYLSSKQAGAQCPDFITPPVKDDYEALIRDFPGVVARWTYAPENDTGAHFTAFLTEKGIVCSAGHTDAKYEDMMAAYNAGCRLITHLYSCTSTITRKDGFRSLGVIETAFLEDGISAEIIADGKHLPPELIRLIYKIKGKDGIVAVTDSLALAGTDVKSGKMQATEFIIEDGVCKLMDRSAFAGSIATADRLVRVLTHEAGIPLTEAVAMVSENPARVMGLENKGSLTSGYDADIVIFDTDINVKAVFVGGKPVIDNK